MLQISHHFLEESRKNRMCELDLRFKLNPPKTLMNQFTCAATLIRLDRVTKVTFTDEAAVSIFTLTTQTDVTIQRAFINI